MTPRSGTGNLARPASPTLRLTRRRATLDATHIATVGATARSAPSRASCPQRATNLGGVGSARFRGGKSAKMLRLLLANGSGDSETAGRAALRLLLVRRALGNLNVDATYRGRRSAGQRM